MTLKDISLSEGNIVYVGTNINNSCVRLAVSEEGNQAEVWLTYEEVRTLIDELETLKGNLEPNNNTTS